MPGGRMHYGYVWGKAAIHRLKSQTETSQDKAKAVAGLTVRSSRAQLSFADASSRAGRRVGKARYTPRTEPSPTSSPSSTSDLAPTEPAEGSPALLHALSMVPAALSMGESWPWLVVAAAPAAAAAAAAADVAVVREAMSMHTSRVG